jgi:hypothetical protein
MRKRLFGLVNVAVAALVLPLATACGGGPEVGDDTQATVVIVTGFASSPEVASIGMPQGGLAIARAYLSASAMTLVPCSPNSASIGLDPRGYDLLDEPPASEAVGSAVRNWCALRIDIDGSNSSKGVPKGSSLYVEGQDADGNPLAIASTDATSVLLQVKGDASFGTEPVLLGVDVSKWLDGLPLGADMTDLAAAQLLDALPSATALYVDANHNDVLDADEQKEPIAVGK